MGQPLSYCVQFQGLLVCALEVVAISTLVLLVVAEFSPDVSILLFSGIFITQTIVNVFDNDACCGVRPQYQKASLAELERQRRVSGLPAAFCSVSSKLFAFMLQLTGILGLVGYFLYKSLVLGDALEYRVVVGMPLSLLVLSVVWSNRCQKFIARSPNKDVSARYKSSKSFIYYYNYALQMYHKILRPLSKYGNLIL